MSLLPRDRQEFLRAGYQFLGDSTCRNCNAPVEWWQTTKGKKVPFNAPQAAPGTADRLAEEAVLHWEVCPGAKLGTVGQALDANARKRVVRDLAMKLGARAVVVLLDEGYTYATKDGIPAEDVKHELITTANAIRRDMEGGR